MTDTCYQGTVGRRSQRSSEGLVHGVESKSHTVKFPFCNRHHPPIITTVRRRRRRHFDASLIEYTLSSWPVSLSVYLHSSALNLTSLNFDLIEGCSMLYTYWPIEILLDPVSDVILAAMFIQYPRMSIWELRSWPY